MMVAIQRQAARAARIAAMTTSIPSPAAEPVELLLVLGLAVVRAALVLAAAVVALLLTLAGWRPPAPPAAAPVLAITLAALAEVAAAELEALPVAELRRRGRAAGLPRSITRTGRRAALVPLLAGLEVALA